MYLAHGQVDEFLWSRQRRREDYIKILPVDNLKEGETRLVSWEEPTIWDEISQRKNELRNLLDML